MTDLYVYYRVAAHRAAEARLAAAALLDAVTRSSGLTGTLHRREDDPSTWMEVYRKVDDADQFIALLNTAVTASGLEVCLDGERHVERFVPCA